MIEDPVLRQRLEFTRTTDEDGVDVLHVETWIDPGCWRRSGDFGRASAHGS